MLNPDQIADYLLQHPEFFDTYVDVLDRIRIKSAIGARAISLQERQIELLREKYKSLEMRMHELLRIGQQNDQLAQHLHELAADLLRVTDTTARVQVLLDLLKTRFHIPQVSLRLWLDDENVSAPQAWYWQDVSESIRVFSKSLQVPYCGQNHDFEAVAWLASDHEKAAESLRSVAMLPLKNTQTADHFGLLVMGSSDEKRFTPDMGLDFLTRVQEIASAALCVLLPVSASVENAAEELV